MHSITRAARGLPRPSTCSGRPEFVEGRRSRAARRRVLLIGIALAAMTAILAQRASHAQQPPPYSKWDQYGGSSDSMQYSSLAQINKTNVKQLQRAWFYPVAGEPESLVFNPLIVDNVMYVTGVRGVACRARRHDRQRAVDVDAAGDRARAGLLGKQGPLGPPPHPDREQRHPRSRRAHRAADHDVRQQRVRRHARRHPAAQRRPEQQPRTRLRESPHRRIERRRGLRLAARATSARTTCSAASSCGRSTRFRGPVNTDTKRGPRMPSDTPAARTRGAISRSTTRTASSFCRPDRQRTISTAAIAQGNNLFGNCLLALDARTGKAPVAFPDRASRSLGLRQCRRAEAADRAAQRQAGRDRRAGGQDRIPLRFRTENRHAAMADRRTARAEERSAW